MLSQVSVGMHARFKVRMTLSHIKPQADPRHPFRTSQAVEMPSAPHLPNQKLPQLSGERMNYDKSRLHFTVDIMFILYSLSLTHFTAWTEPIE